MGYIDLERLKNISKVAFYQALVFQAEGLLILIDKDGIVTFTTQAIGDQLGYSSKEVVGKSLTQICHPEDKGDLTELISSLQNDDSRPRQTEIRLKHANGSTMFFTCKCKSLLENPDVRGILLTLTDITEQKIAEDALKRSERKYQDLAELLPESIFELNSEGSIRFANPSAAENFDYTDGDLQGLTIMDLMVEANHAKIKERIAAIFNGEQIKAIEYTAKKKDGSLFPVLVHSSAIQNPDGIITGVRTIVIDISDLKLTQQKLLSSYKHLGILNRHVAILLDLARASLKDDDKEVYMDLLVKVTELTQAKRACFYELDKNSNILNVCAELGLNKKHKDETCELVKNTKSWLQSYNEDRPYRILSHPDFKQDSKNQLPWVILPLENPENSTKHVILLGFGDDQKLNEQDLGFLELARLQIESLLTKSS